MLIIGGLLFALMAAAHIARFLLELEVSIGGWPLPVWASLPAALILILLSYLFFRAAAR